MKKIYFIFLALFLAGCSSLSTLTISVVQPPLVHTDRSATKIGIINRPAQQNERNGLFNDLEEILTAETFNIDDEAIDVIINAFGETVTNRTKFMNAKTVNYTIADGTFRLSLFPNQLSWNAVEDICKKNDIDILVELSFFDTDTEVDYRTVDKVIEVPVLGEKTIKEHIADLNTRIKCGWRIYDPKTRIIEDEFAFNSNFSLSGRGATPFIALQGIVQKRDEILRQSRFIGEEYAFRLIPQNLRVRRYYYVRGNDALEKAQRYAQAGDWDGAGNIWKKETQNPDEKIRERALYNMAIISEINGDLDQAIEFAQKTYIEYENRRALEYVEILRDRQRAIDYMEANY